MAVSRLHRLLQVALLALLAAAAAPAWAKQDALFVTGSNYGGQLGLGDTVNRTTFTRVPGTMGVAAMTGGEAHSVILMDDGTIRTAGNNGFGELGQGDTTLRSTFTNVAALSNVAVIACGRSCSLARKEDGTVWGAGTNGQGQLGFFNQYNDPFPSFVQLPGISGINAIAGGEARTFAVSSADGSVRVAGTGWYGEIGFPGPVMAASFVQIPVLTDITDVSTGWVHSAARKEDGTLWTAGSNEYGQLGLGNNTDTDAFTQVPSFSDVDTVICGHRHTLALKDNGTVWGTGWNAYGQLGAGDTADRTAFTQAAGLDNVVAIATGAYHSLALKSNGTLWGAGSNGQGELGLGKVEGAQVFTQIPLAGVHVIGAGYGSSSLAVADYGVQVAWPSDTGVVVELGTICYISWDSFNLPTKAAVKIELVKESGGTWILSASAKKSPFKWTVGKTIKGNPMYTIADDYKIRVSLLDGSDSDESDNNFTIDNVNKLTIAGPMNITGGEAAQYTCTAQYDFSPDRDVTNLVTWKCSSKSARVSATGLVTTKVVTTPQNCTLNAYYGKGQNVRVGGFGFNITP